MRITMIGKLVLIVLAGLANWYVWTHKYPEDEAQLSIWHKVFAVSLALGALSNLF
jgi:uncharacterized membrane protein